MSLAANNFPKQKRRRPLLTTLILVLWVVVMGGLFLNRQNIMDWWKLRNYSAPAVIQNLADQDKFTDYGRKVFYVNYPSLRPKSNFKEVCPQNGGEKTIVLGCYIGNQNGIYVLDVTDVRLNGVEEVTAAHEMLHAAYERLSTKDRDQVNALLQDYYKNDLHDERILSIIDAYKKSEPNDVVNEMHSVFGTEIANLPTPLETYYKRYFKDRSVVTNFANQYQAEFTSRKEKLAADDAKLADLKSQIQAGEADLKRQIVAIEAEQQRLQTLRNAGNISSYNAGVPGYNALVSQYNGEVKAIQTLVDQYNQLVTERNAIAIEQQELVNSLSTDAAPIKN